MTKKNPRSHQHKFGAAGKKAAKEGLKPGTKAFGARVKALMKG